MAEESKVGVVSHFFDKIGVAAVELTDGALAVGDAIHIKGHVTDVTVAVESMQIEHGAVQSAEKGASVGVKIAEKAREHDVVYKVSP
ncbi:MAG: hypothetical protein JXR37_12735 [Kiritimatiellae bacterium]|nr:hypothetical protein [Kiritimatiellia bacterium]